MYKEIYRNYLNERRGVHLIFYLSEETLIRCGVRSLKKCKVGTS